MRYQTTHVTTYHYDQPVAQCLTEAHLIPRSFPGQQVLEAKISVEPPAADAEHRTDYYGNDVATFSVRTAHDSFIVTATGLI